MASQQTISQGQRRGSGFHPGLTGNIILPKHFNNKAGQGIASPSRDILIPGEDGYIPDENGILQRDLSVYVPPRRTYFFFNQSSVSVKNSSSVPCPSLPQSAAPLAPDHSSVLASVVSGHAESEASGSSKDYQWVDRIREVIIGDIDKVRISMDLPTVQQVLDTKRKRLDF